MIKIFTLDCLIISSHIIPDASVKRAVVVGREVDFDPEVTGMNPTGVQSL